MEITICQCWPPAIPTLISRATEVQLMQTQFCWIPDSKVYKCSKVQLKTREIWVFKNDNWILPANRFREETNPNYIPKHPNRHPSFYFNNLAPLVNQSRRSRKEITNLKPPTTNQLQATSRQPPSHLNFDFSYLQFIYK